MIRHAPSPLLAVRSLTVALASATFLGVMLLGAVSPAHAAPSPADAIVGIWLTEAGEQGGKARVEIRREGGTYTGRIVWLEEPRFESGEHLGEEKRDLENPDAGLRDRPILGLPILQDFSSESEGTWGGGTIYDPANGKTYRAKLYLDGSDDPTLEIRGYVGIPLFGRTTTWTRVEA